MKKIVSWIKAQFKSEDRSTYEWEEIGSKMPIHGGDNVSNVPKWVLKAYSKTDVHHDGVVCRFNGNTYQYKVVESGQGGGYATFYRRLKFGKKPKFDSGKSET